MIHCLIGESASGKSTTEKRLELLGYNRIISYTTRMPRKGEIDGVHYHFIDEDTFFEMERAGEFQETAKYREWYYGISLNGIDYQDQDYIAVVTIHGYLSLLNEVGRDNISAIYLKIDERERMRRLLERGDDVDEIIRRIQTDRKDFEFAEVFCDHTVESLNIDKTVEMVLDTIN